MEEINKIIQKVDDIINELPQLEALDFLQELAGELDDRIAGIELDMRECN